jgi:hypothetical protein
MPAIAIDPVTPTLAAIAAAPARRFTYIGYWFPSV